MKKWKIVSIGLLLAFSFYQKVQAVVQSKNIKTVVESDTVKGEKKEVTVDKLKKPTAYERLFQDKIYKSCLLYTSPSPRDS